MPIGEIKEKYFISPREAVQIIGKATFGPEWRADLPNDDPMMKAALRSLYKALQSGVAKADYYETGQQPRPLTPAMADDELFTISLKHDGCLFGSPQWPPNILKIYKSSLDTYISSRRKFNYDPKISELKNYIRWLETKLSDATYVATKQDLISDAKILFPSLSERMLNTERQRLARQCERFDLLKPGRRKRLPQNQNTAGD